MYTFIRQTANFLVKKKLWWPWFTKRMHTSVLGFHWHIKSLDQGINSLFQHINVLNQSINSLYELICFTAMGGVINDHDIVVITLLATFFNGPKYRHCYLFQLICPWRGLNSDCWSRKPTYYQWSHAYLFIIIAYCKILVGPI